MCIFICNYHIYIIHMYNLQSIHNWRLCFSLPNLNTFIPLSQLHPKVNDGTSPLNTLLLKLNIWHFHECFP